MPRFDEIPVIDQHLHPPLTQAEADGRDPASFFSETHDEETLARHVPHLRFFRQAIRDLAVLLGCEPDVHDVTAARRALGPGAMLRLCVQRGNVAGLIVDDGYPPAPIGMTPAMMATAAGCPALRVLRLERLAGELAATYDDLPGYNAALLGALERAHIGGTVALKSIVAYRCGLTFRLPSSAEASVGLRLEHGSASGGYARLTDPRLLYHTLALALEWAGDTGLPVQIHTGFGDHDLHLERANPALLRPLFEESRFNRGPLVLLHANYPYSREAGYLAGIYPRLYVDWSQANPLLAGPVLVRVLQELLALAPVTKLLYGSDAWGIPDWIWLGAHYGREALAAALGDDQNSAADARRILHDNTVELYGLA